MSNTEERSAEQLEKVIAARQAGRPLPARDEHDQLDSAARQTASDLVDAARGARMDPVFAAKLESELNRIHAAIASARGASFWGRWETWLASIALRSSRSVGLAVMASLLLALVSFAIFRGIQSQTGQPSTGTQAPVIAYQTSSATPTSTTASPTNTASPTAEPSSTSVVVVEATPAAPTATVSATAVIAAPAASATRTPTARPPTPRPTSTPAPTTAMTTHVKIYMIALSDGSTNGPIGCGDEAVAVDRTIPATAAPLSAAIRELISQHDMNYGQSGLYNSMYRSTLTFDSATIVGGRAIINLSGSMRLGGVCDIPRAIAQIEKTALQFSTVSQVTTYLNGIEINAALSQK